MMRTIITWTVCIMILIPALLHSMLRQRLENDDNLHVGDRFHLIVSGDVALLKAVAPDTLTQFKILQTENVKADSEPDALRLTIVPLRLGRLSFPPLRIVTETAQAESLYTDAFSVNVLAVRAEGDTLLRDITPVQRYRMELPWWAYWTLTGIAFALLIAIILILILNRRTPKPVVSESPRSEDERPPWRIALEELSRLLAENLVEQGRFVEFHFRLSLVLRLYLELENQFPAMEMTTTEIRQYLRSHTPPLAHSNQIIDFLIYCDRVKFAKYETDKRQTEERVEWLKHYLLEPREKPEAETDKDDAVSAGSSNTSEERTDA